MQLERQKAANEMQMDMAQMAMDARLEQIKLAHHIATNAVVPDPGRRQ